MNSRRYITISALFLILVAGAVYSQPRQNERARLDQIEKALKADVPRILCLDSSFATGAQPKESAFSKMAVNGFRSFLSLRPATEGIDLKRERSLVEKYKMHYFNIPVVSSAPRPDQADEFIRIVKEKSNHPMLIACASANRVGAFMMIYRVVGQGWSEQRALEEANRIGLRSEALRQFAQDYIARQKAKSG
jgi:protein tyrosine phosphatase (PTP) superfamily phosphohydrolase (DUF442 family)